MKFPPSNLAGNFDWSSLWGMPELVGSKTSAKYGFTDFRLENIFPIFKSILTDYEYHWNHFAEATLFLRNAWWFSIVVSILYVIALPVGQRIMRDRKAFDLKYPLFLWNLALAIFSIIGTLRILPPLLYGVATNGPMYYMCRSGFVAYGRGPMGLWTIAFSLSKYAELIDTLFLVLRKKQVPFLHWFHHATVLLLSIGTTMLYGPTGVVMLGMNYFVHAIMYTYYAIAAIGKPPKWGKFVTKLQILQMVNGLLISVGATYGALYVENCEYNKTNLIGITLIYMSYLVLFVQFYVKRYAEKRKEA